MKRQVLWLTTLAACAHPGSPMTVNVGRSGVAVERDGEVFVFALGRCVDGRREAPADADLAWLAKSLGAQRPASVTAHAAPRDAAYAKAVAAALGAADGAPLPMPLDGDGGCATLVEQYLRAATSTATGPRPPEGALTKDEIGQVIRGARPRFRACYEKALDRDPELLGKVGVQFLIGPEGAVVGTEVLTDSVGRGVGACVGEVMRSLRFPPPKGGGVVYVTYPFVFKTTDSATGIE